MLLRIKTNSRCTMETKNHFKNGASSKSLMNRVSFIILMLCASALCFSASGCKSLDNTMLNPANKNQALLPPLNPVFDVESFGTVFPLSISRGSAYATSYGASFSSATYSNPTLHDINLIFERNVEGNICVPDFTGQKKGTIKCKLVSGDHSENLGCLAPSILTIFTLNLLGMPIVSDTIDLQTEVTIFDRNNRLIGKYTSDSYSHKSWTALYWGYSGKDAPRNSARVVFIKCMEDIKQKIDKDSNRLNNALR